MSRAYSPAQLDHKKRMETRRLDRAARVVGFQAIARKPNPKRLPPTALELLQMAAAQEAARDKDFRKMMRWVERHAAKVERRSSPEGQRIYFEATAKRDRKNEVRKHNEFQCRTSAWYADVRLRNYAELIQRRAAC